jgi:two-component system LytT family response regulator
MYKIVIVEDEFNAQQALSKMLRLLYHQIQIVGVFPSVQEGKAFLEENQVDLVFFDIELEDGCSLDYLKQLKTIDFQIIFTTGFNQYAIDAIKLSAVDYLLKPIDPEELRVAVEKAMQNIVKQNEISKQFEALDDNRKGKERKLVVKTAHNTYFFKLDDIIMLESDGAYSKIISVEKTVMASKHLKYFEGLLQNSNFIRTHQSHIINPKHIKSIQKNDVLLSNQLVAKIATRKYTEVMSQIKAYSSL